MNRCFGIIGGDRRQGALAELLEADGHTVYSYGLPGRQTGSLDQAAAAPVVVLPLPLCRGEGVLNCQEAPLPTAELFRHFHPGQRLLAGKVEAEQRREAEERGLALEDYFCREALTVANAAATAEGAVQTAMERLDRTLLGMDCLVLGFGRIGRLLSCRLHGLGARVSAAARRPEDLAWVRAYGWQALEISRLDGNLSSFGAVFNTVPSPVLDGPLLAQLPSECLCVDLASRQGIDLEAARELGLPHVWARSLPGRLTPRTAAAAIRDTVYYMLREG
nr:dipicolinate synthase subunit DpsA [uncultured Dysosmobacter sp.]